MTLDPSSLPGTHRTRVFVGGSYVPASRLLLGVIESAVRGAGFEPILADHYRLLRPELDVHDVTLFLLHSCRLAVFELSTLSGALMEVERCSDYGVARALVLYQDPFNRRWPKVASAWPGTSAMVRSLMREHTTRFTVLPYVRPADADRRAVRFLTAIRRSVYGKLHGL